MAGAKASLAALDAIAAELDGYHLLHSARGTMLARLGRPDEARLALERAGRLAATEPERRFLERQIGELAVD